MRITYVKTKGERVKHGTLVFHSSFSSQWQDKSWMFSTFCVVFKWDSNRTREISLARRRGYWGECELGGFHNGWPASPAECLRCVSPKKLNIATHLSLWPDHQGTWWKTEGCWREGERHCAWYHVKLAASEIKLYKNVSWTACGLSSWYLSLFSGRHDKVPKLSDLRKSMQYYSAIHPYLIGLSYWVRLWPLN